MRPDYDLDDIESIPNIGPVQQPKPVFRRADDPLLFGEIDGFMGWPKQVCRPGLHFNENQSVFATVPAYKVDFAATPGLKIPIQDFIPVPPEEASRQVFAARPENKVRRDLSANYPPLKKGRR